VIVTTGESIKTAFEEYELIANQLNSKIDGFNSLAILVPSINQQKENLKEWKKFWSKEKILSVKTNFNKALEPYGFQKKSFDNFFSLLESENIEAKDQIPNVLKLFEPHFIKHRQSYSLLSFFDDTKKNIDIVESVMKKTNNSYVVSRRELSSLVGEQLILDMKKISIFASLWIIILIVIFLKKPRIIFLALLPVITSISFVFLILTLISMQVTAIVLIALIIILGVSLDYGVFISSANSIEERKSVILAATFSMLTTIMGAGALLFASHPVMFSIGITIVSGVIAAYLTAVFCIPAFQKVFK
jgi:hypothetical protein